MAIKAAKRGKETSLKKAITKYLRDVRGLTPIRIHGGAMFGVHQNKQGEYRKWAVQHNRKGAPDLMVHVPPNGRGVAIETKAKDGKQSPAQMEWQAALEKVGCVYVLAKTLDDVHDALSGKQ